MNELIQLILLMIHFRKGGLDDNGDSSALKKHPELMLITAAIFILYHLFK